MTHCFFNKTTHEQEEFVHLDDFMEEYEQSDEFLFPMTSAMRLGHHHGCGVDKQCFSNADSIMGVCDYVAFGCGNYKTCFDKFVDLRKALAQAETDWENALDTCMHTGCPA